MKPSRILLPICLLVVALSNFASSQDVNRTRAMAKDILHIVSSDIEKNYYDPKFHGLDWKAETERTRQQIDKANSAGDAFTAIVALVEELHDSHTFFIPPQRVAEARFGFWAKPCGDQVLVYKLEKDGAAEKAGLQLGDRLAVVNGFRVDRSSYDLMMLYFRLMKPVVRMEMVVDRAGVIIPVAVNAVIKEGQKVQDLTGDHIWELIREEQSEEAKADKVLCNRLPGDIGYVRIPEFSEDNDFYNRLLKKIEGSKAVVVDLRNNPGGRTDSLSDLAGHFQDHDDHMADIITRKKTDEIRVKSRPPYFSGPMFVLVDAHSMSSSEMFAHYFQQQKRATIIGDNTLGRVNAAQIFHEKIGLDDIVPFRIEISVGRVVFPGGLELETKGVVPNELCIPSQQELHDKHDKCLDLAVKLAQKAIDYKPEVPKLETKN